MWETGWWDFLHDDTDSKNRRVTWPLIKRVLNYARPYRTHIIFLMITMVVSTSIGLLNPLILRDLLDNAIPNMDVGRLNLLALGLVAIPIINSAIGIFARRLNSLIGEGVIHNLRVSIYAHLQRMSLRFFTNTKTGELMSRLNNDVVDAQNVISNTIVDMITNLIQVIATLAVMLALEWRLTILGVALLPLFVFVARRIGYRLRTIIRQQMNYNAQMNAMMSETLNISGALLVKLFGRRDREIDRFADRAGRVRDIGIERAVLGNQFFAIISLLGVVGTALVYWVGGHFVLNQTWSVGDLVAFSAYLAGLYGPLQTLTNAPVLLASSIVSFERVFEVVDLPLEIAEKPNAVELSNVRGEMVFENVSFNYDSGDGGLLRKVERMWGYDDSVTLSLEEGLSEADSDKSDDANKTNTDDNPAASSTYTQARDTALTDVSFEINPGELVALVGPSGAGKTTMTYLIPRLYDPTTGRITIDGHDLRDVELDSLAEQIGMVTQETYLFHDTLRANLLYANPGATLAEIEAACKAANIHDFIMALPEGYETVAGERGYRLSGGEKQRIAIARVILKDPRILVLDEATSHL
ncbi:MAG: ABC transporter ATP-binding protein, partial [Burkholderiales bacterium]|nr:ABC transporter ATP-binding protein [Anaerolineae bacterium]